MKKKWTALVLSGALLCALSVPALAAGSTPPASTSEAETTEEPQTIPDSCLYYGEVKEILKDDSGAITGLLLDSPKSGEYQMIISGETVWIDSGSRTASDPATLEEGERLYVFHSPMSTRSIPPQSAAFAVVRNIPQDAMCAQYHTVEEVSLEDGQLKITTDNGGLYISANEDTMLSSYGGDAEIKLEDIQAGSRVMAWYGVIATSYPGQAHASHLMLLPENTVPNEDAAPLTRGGLVTLLHEQAGKPVVNFAMNYTDVSADAEYAEAIRWATSEGIIGGYGNGKFGPDDVMERQQLVTVLWRYAGSPMLMDYTGLIQYEDVSDVSRYAQQAMAWAHQKKLVGTDSIQLLDPLGTVTMEEANKMLQMVEART